MITQHRNICKFVPEVRGKDLNATQFIYESQISPEGREFSAKGEMLILVAEGSGTLTLDGEIRRITRGNLFFVFSGQTFRIENVEGLAFLYITFHGNRVIELYDRFGICRAYRFFPEMDGLIPAFRESLLRATDENIDLLSESMLLYAFSRLRPQSKEDVSLLHAVTEYLEKNYQDPECSLRSLSAKFCYNEKYLSHLVKRQLGVGISEYLRDLRLHYAVLLMESGITSIKNVAALSGFTDPLYFSKVFRAQFGVSPKQYLQKEFPQT